MPVSIVFENLEAGATIDEIMEWFDVSREQVVACWNSRREVWMRHRPRTNPPDHGTPSPLIAFLEGHAVTKAKEAGWHRLVNGELLEAAEAAGFELLVTSDKQMKYQQNLQGRKIAIIVLGNA
jgi:hypothetical protein